jgi:hypothetical protein
MENKWRTIYWHGGGAVAYMVARLTDEEVPPLSPMVINVFQKIVAP